MTRAGTQALVAPRKDKAMIGASVHRRVAGIASAALSSWRPTVVGTHIAPGVRLTKEDEAKRTS